MPHASLKLSPGVDQNRTPALNEAAISTSQFIRFIPDSNGLGLPQKLGGWTKYFANAIGSVVRCLWAWADTNANNYLALGAEEELSVIYEGTQLNITPSTDTNNVAVAIDTTDGSSVVLITDTGSNVTSYDVVDIRTQISVGGLILFGLYRCFAVSANTYQIRAVDALGSPAFATATVNDGGAVSVFDTTSGTSLVEVTLDDHGYFAGDTFPILVSTAVGGITLFGNYTIVSVTDADTFVIQASNAATSTTTESENGGDARYVYYIGQGPLPTGTGYGVGGYGEGGYGSGITPTANTGTLITATDWTLDNFGAILVACPYGGPIYTWDAQINQPTAVVIPEAPSANAGMFVAMPQRQIIAWGSTFNGVIDPLLIRWCDIEDLNDWIGTVTNQAGSYRIPRGSSVVGCIQGPQQGLIWTDLALWAMQYTGQPYVYGFNEIGTGCGLIAPKAATSMNGVVYWMSQSQFFTLSGDGVKPIFCPIWDVIFQDLDPDNLDKIRIAANSRFGEISWFYPITGSGGVPAKYAKYNINLQKWDFGTLSRTAWINQSVLGPPIGAGPPISGPQNQYIYQHETSTDADDEAMLSSFQTGYFALSEGDVKQFVDQVWPDMKWGYFNGTQNANISLTFYVADYPGETPTAYGPFTLTQATQFVTPRFRARLMAINISSSDVGSFWRLGNIRYRTQVDGKF